MHFLHKNQPVVSLFLPFVADTKPLRREKNCKEAPATQQKFTAWSDVCYWSICLHDFLRGLFQWPSLSKQFAENAAAVLHLGYSEHKEMSTPSAEWCLLNCSCKSESWHLQGGNLIKSPWWLFLRPTEYWKRCQCAWWFSQTDLFCKEWQQTHICTIIPSWSPNELQY